MASSQVEYASSGSFGSVLRDHNRRDGCRESNARATQATFQKNLKNFVSNHYNSCISISSDSVHSENNQNQNQNQNQISNAGSWVSNVAKNELGNLRFTSSSSHNNREREEALRAPRNSRFLDQWAARKARQMVSTIEDEATLLALPNSASPAPSEGSNLGASSLVQIWEKRLNQSKSSAVASAGRWSPTASVTSSNENTISADEQSKGSEAGESADERQVNEESFPDWESDRTAPNDQTYSEKAQNSGVAEIKRVRVRVVDIIKRLIATSKMQNPLSSHTENNNHDQCTNNNTGSQHQETPEVSDHIVFSQVINSPRIRGRQAFKDLLMQMERDRRTELHSLSDRKVVSMFTQRGRIQSLLRLRLLQRDVAAHDPSRQQSAASELSKQQQKEGSSIMHLRERFKTAAEQGTTTQDESTNVRNPPREKINKNITQFNNSYNLDQLRGGIHTTEPILQASANCKEGKAQPSSSVATCINSEEIVETTPAVADSNGNGTVDEEEARDQQYTYAEASYNESLEEEEASEQQYAESHCTDTADEADATSEQYYYEEPSYDWISNISRPRSYWEDRRRAWYREMLETGSNNEEICQLLERRTVSNVLSSDFREKMDRLMESHMGSQAHLIRSQEDEDENRGRMEHLIQFLQERMHPEGEEDDDEKIEADEGKEEGEEEEQKEGAIVEEEQGEEEKLEEEGSLISSQYHEVGNYFNQSSSSMHAASPSTTWSDRDNETVDESDIITSASSPQPCQSRSFYRDSRQYSSSANHHSIEMELIYDLRGNMAQLYQEMAELRKSIKTCIDMQMTLQQSMARDDHTVKEEKKTPNRKPKKGNCCICYEMKVDSLLYRCGHMCACLKCANELQWNSGKCPICRAPIVDVVRVYVDTETCVHL